MSLDSEETDEINVYNSRASLNEPQTSTGDVASEPSNSLGSGSPLPLNNNNNGLFSATNLELRPASPVLPPLLEAEGRNQFQIRPFEELQPYSDYGPLSSDFKPRTREEILENIESDDKHPEDSSVPLVALKEFKQIMLSQQNLFQQQVENTQKLFLNQISDLKEHVSSLEQDLRLQRDRIDRLTEGRNIPDGSIATINNELSSLRDKVLKLSKSMNEDASSLNDQDLINDGECCICLDHCHKVVRMPAECKHLLCVDCFVAHFESVVKNQTMRSFSCPACNQPEIPWTDFPQPVEEYFRSLSQLIKKHIGSDIHGLFEKKLAESCVLNIPGIKLMYCPTCKEAFTKDRMDCLVTKCPKCNHCMCPHCKKKMSSGDQRCPNRQCVKTAESESKRLESASVETYIKNTLVECPSCKAQFSLDPTGCDHLQCSQCQFEFCRCCGRPYRHGRDCSVLSSCERRGLHAHHPRNCFYFLRDLPSDWLEKMLTENDKPFGQSLGVLTDSDTSKGVCAWGKDDIRCERKKEETSDLCSFHYTDYLVSRIRSENLDPAEAFDTEELTNVLTREGLSPPKKRIFKSEIQYRLELIDYVKNHLPLEDYSGGPVQPGKSSCVVM